MGKVKCLVCGEILESKYRHDFVECKCENHTFVDGGNDYLRSGGKDINMVAVWNSTKKEFIKNNVTIEPEEHSEYRTLPTKEQQVTEIIDGLAEEIIRLKSIPEYIYSKLKNSLLKGNKRDIEEIWRFFYDN